MNDNVVSRFSRRRLLAGTTGVVLPSVAMVAAVPLIALDTPVASAAPRRPQTRQVTIYAETMDGSLVGYGLTEGEPTIPGPLLEIYEGDTLEIELVNKTSQRLSIHPHGVDYETDSDGAPLNDSFNKPGETRTYTWRTRKATEVAEGHWLPGSAGYWHYHDHALGTDHGSGGIARGLYGGLIVRRAGDLLPDRQYTVVFNEMTINNKVAPETPMFEARQGERVEFVCIGHGNLPHTFHLHAHKWADNRTGLLTGPDDRTPSVDNKNLDPGSSFGFQVIAGEGVGPGTWMYHCHVQSHAEDGMVGLFLVRKPDGSMPVGAQDAIDRFHEGHGGHSSSSSSSSSSGHGGH